MDDVDLDLNNYDLDDVLNLFHLNHDFTYKDLKGAMKIMHKVHPDKSSLDSKYFIFFKEAYSILLGLYKHRNSTNKSSFREDYYTKEHAIKLKNFIDSETFNEQFNTLFEETFRRETYGYDDWLKNEPIDDYTIENRNTYFDNKHNNIVIRNNDEIKDINSSIGNNYIDANNVEDYSSSTFNSLKFEDVKKAYSETFIPVNVNDDRIGMFNSIDELKRFRGNDNIKEMSQTESEEYLENEKYSENKQMNNKIYNLIKQDKNYQHEKQKWWNKFNKLCY
jgi:hypothetical protein